MAVNYSLLSLYAYIVGSAIQLNTVCALLSFFIFNKLFKETF